MKETAFDNEPIGAKYVERLFSLWNLKQRRSLTDGNGLDAENSPSILVAMHFHFFSRRQTLPMTKTNFKDKATLSFLLLSLTIDSTKNKPPNDNYKRLVDFMVQCGLEMFTQRIDQLCCSTVMIVVPLRRRHADVASLARKDSFRFFIPLSAEIDEKERTSLLCT